MKFQRAEDVVPPNILAAARRCGLRSPDWYIGRHVGPPRPRRKTLADLVEEVEARSPDMLKGSE